MANAAAAATQNELALAPHQEKPLSPPTSAHTDHIVIPHQDSPPTSTHRARRACLPSGVEAKEASPNNPLCPSPTTDDHGSPAASVGPPRALPAVAAFTVQCAMCLKWRIIPTKKKYEEIREFILQKPFLCTDAVGWRPCACCDEPSDLSQDMSHLWAMDKPNIPSPPTGWERLLVLRGAGSSKFADVYYVAPSGRKLRSLPEVERFLQEFPQYVHAGVTLSQFSFVIPRPLDETYVKKRGSPAVGMRGRVAAKKPKGDGGRKRKQGQRLLASSIKQGLQKLTGRTKVLARMGAGSKSRASVAISKEDSVALSKEEGIPFLTLEAQPQKQGLPESSVYGRSPRQLANVVIDS